MKLALFASTALVTPFAEQSNSVQLRKFPANGGNIVNGPEVVETVTIQTDAGNVRINATDYDPAKHTLAEGQAAPASAAAAPAEPAQAPPPPPVAVAPDPNAPPAGNAPPAPPSAATTPPPVVEKFVTKTGKKWFVTDKDGKPLDAAHAGYDSEAEAQAAVKA
jgi:hypothetical protein